MLYEISTFCVFFLHIFFYIYLQFVSIKDKVSVPDRLTGKNETHLSASLSVWFLENCRKFYNFHNLQYICVLLTQPVSLGRMDSDWSVTMVVGHVSDDTLQSAVLVIYRN